MQLLTDKQIRRVIEDEDKRGHDYELCEWEEDEETQAVITELIEFGMDYFRAVAKAQWHECNHTRWNAVNKKKPRLGDVVMVYEHSSGDDGGYWLARYIKNPRDKRKSVFADPLQTRHSISSNVWIYQNVTHWTVLPPSPEIIV